MIPTLQLAQFGRGGKQLGDQQPVVQSSATSAQTTAQSSHPITMPSGIVAHDLLILAFSAVGVTFNTPSGWSLVCQQDSTGNGSSLLIYSKIAAGSDTVTVTTTGSGRSAAVCLRVSPAVFVYNSTAVSAFSENAPDAPALAPGNGIINYLWLAVYVSYADGLISAMPTGFTSVAAVDSTTGSSGCSVAVGKKSEAAASVDPAAATATGNRNWAMATLGLVN